MLGVDAILKRRGVDVDEDGRQAWTAGIGKAESRGVDRECIGERRAFEHRQCWNFVTSRVHDAGIANCPVSFSCEHLRARAMHSHLYRAELAIKGSVLRRISQEVMELVVLV